MRRTSLSLSALLVLLSNASSVPGQHEHHGIHKMAADARVEVLDDAAGQVLTVRAGPINLPARSDHTAVAQAPELFLEIPFDCWIVAYHPRLVDADGAVLPGRLLHHVGYWNTARSDFLCPNNEEHIFGAGGEMNDWPALPGFGYRVRKGERIRIGTMFHNPTDTGHPSSYIEVKVEYRRPAPEGPQLRSVYPTWFDVQKCGRSGYDLKPGRNVTTGDFNVPYSGTLLGVGGHLHDYGQELVLFNLTRNEEIATLHSKLAPGGRIVSMPIVSFLDRGGYRLKQGERIRVTATYDNRTGKHLTDAAMGIAVGYFLADDDSQMTALRRKQD